MTGKVFLTITRMVIFTNLLFHSRIITLGPLVRVVTSNDVCNCPEIARGQKVFKERVLLFFDTY